MYIDISSYTFHYSAFENGLLTALTFPSFCLREFGVKHVEFYDPDFFCGCKPASGIAGVSPNHDCVQEVKDACESCEDQEGEKVNISIAAISAQNDLTSSNEKQRQADIERLKLWIDVGEAAGVGVLRINTGGGFAGSFDDALGLLRDGLKELLPRAEEKGIILAVENHPIDLKSLDEAERLVQMVIDLDSEFVGTCPDNGAIADEVRGECLDMLFTVAKHCHVKFYEFDDKGDETTLNYPEFFSIARDNGYKGALSIEIIPPPSPAAVPMRIQVNEAVCEKLASANVPEELVTSVRKMAGQDFEDWQTFIALLRQEVPPELLDDYVQTIAENVGKKHPLFERDKEITRKAIELLCRHGASL